MINIKRGEVIEQMEKVRSVVPLFCNGFYYISGNHIIPDK
ncbi:MAG: hypothetical protein K0R15_1908 [Clostridiales bacterium]|jgi:hypothetical protein|nr:hypothetical protein [Clostridiales bacterium]